MMQNEYKIYNTAPSVDTLAALYLEAGFIKDVDMPKLAKAIEGTSCWWIAEDAKSGQTIAIARCLTDWARYACIYDVIVQADRQHQGIGTAIMNAIICALVDADIDTIHLWPSKGKVPFYEKLGFLALSDQPVMYYQTKRFKCLGKLTFKW